MALVSGARSTLNPNAPLFVPASVRQVEDFSPEWWDLVTTSTWFRDYWISQHQGEDIFGDGDGNGFDGNNVVGLLPDNIDLDVDEDILNMEAQFEEFLQSTTEGEHGKKMTGEAMENGFGKNIGTPLGTVSTVTIPVWRDPIRQFEKPARHVPKYSPRLIQQPR